MIRNRDILNCLPLLASALADKYGVKVNIGGDRAYTNGNTIQIPALPMDCGKTAIALAKGYLDHEAAHIRFTDFTCFRHAAVSPVVKHLCNSIEDWRVEKCLLERYPGCKSNLTWLIKHVFLEDAEKAGDENPAFSVLNYVLLVVRSWEVEELKSPLTHTRDVLDNTYPGLASALDKILNRVRLNCPDTKASFDYALDLERIIRAYESQEEKSRV